VQVIDHQHARLLQQFEVSQDLLDDRSAVECWGRGNPLHDAHRTGERIDQR
jgi:hypothetical protein